jgi:hypothetical protein
MTMATRLVSFADKLRIAEFELMRCCVVLSDILERRTAEEPDWDRLTLARRRIQALREAP